MLAMLRVSISAEYTGTNYCSVCLYPTLIYRLNLCLFLFSCVYLTDHVSLHYFVLTFIHSLRKLRMSNTKITDAGLLLLAGEL